MITPGHVPVADCPNCGSRDLAPFARSDPRGRLHFAQRRCAACGLVVSDPRCDEATLAAYYGGDYYERHWPRLLDRSPEAVAERAARVAPEADRIHARLPVGRVLEIGAGTGALLAVLGARGHAVVGVESSRSAAAVAREVHGLDVRVGSFDDVARGLAPASFDLVCAWHVIEHVVDLDGFVRRARSLLRAGGVLWIGTESHETAAAAIGRARAALSGRPRPFATSDEHTLVFTTSSLRDTLARRGFVVERCEQYQPAWTERVRTLRFRTPLSRAWMFAQHAADAIRGRGPLLRAVARREG